MFAACFFLLYLIWFKVTMRCKCLTKLLRRWRIKNMLTLSTHNLLTVFFVIIYLFYGLGSLKMYTIFYKLMKVQYIELSTISLPTLMKMGCLHNGKRLTLCWFMCIVRGGRKKIERNLWLSCLFFKRIDKLSFLDQEFLPNSMSEVSTSFNIKWIRVRTEVMWWMG